MQPILLERDDQLAALQSCFDSAQSGFGSLIFLAGEAGVGKTSVIRHFLSAVEARARIVSGGCDPALTPSPLWPFREMALTSAWPPGQLVVQDAERDDIFQEALRDLRTSSKTTVLVIEDVHWADDTTLDFLRFIGRRLAGLPTVIVASYRNDDLRQIRPLRLVLGDLGNAAGVRRMTITPLSQAAVARLATGRPIDVDRLYERTLGNPFFVSEILDSDGSIPESVKDVVLARIGRLSAGARTLLDLIAVRGQLIDRKLLARIPMTGIDSSIDECIECGVIETGDNFVAFKHELSREAVLSDLSRTRTSQLSGMLFHALENGDGRTDPALLAQFAFDAGYWQETVRYSTAAGDRAKALRSHREAIAHYKMAVAQSDGLTVEGRSGLLQKLAEVTYFCGRGPTEITVLEDLVSICRETNDRRRLAENLEWLAAVHSEEGRTNAALCAIQEAIDLVRSIPEEALHGKILCTFAHILIPIGRFRESIGWANEALELAERYDDRQTSVRALIALGASQLHLDEPTGICTLERATDLAKQHGFDSDVVHSLANLGGYFASSFRYPEAKRYFEDLVAFATNCGLECWKRYGQYHLAGVHLYRGEWNLPAELIPAMSYADHGCLENQLILLLTAGRIRARQGDPDWQEALDKASSLVPPDASPYLISDLHSARAEAAWLSGNREAALAEASLGLSSALAVPDCHHLGALAYYIRCAGGDCELPFDPIEPYRLQLQGHWQAASDAWAALGCPYEAARALSDSQDEEALRTAVSEFERLGARPMANIAIRKLRALGVNAVPRGPRPATRTNPFGLTKREVEVLDCVSLGWTNDEIADRLFVSSKTIEQHLSSIFAKLGVNTRGKASERMRAYSVQQAALAN